MSEDQLGFIAANLAFNFPLWVERRVDHVTYLDDVTLRRRQSVTIRWPSPEFFPEGARPTAGDRIYVPLDVLRKQPLVDFDATGADGQPLPVPATERNERLAARGLAVLLVAHASERLKEALTAESISAIEAVVTARPELALRLLARLERGPSQLGPLLRLGDDMSGFFRDLGERFLLLAPMTYEPEMETIVKLAYTQQNPWSRSFRNIAAHFGLADLRADLAGLMLGYGRSYHIEINAPAEVRMARAVLFGAYAYEGPRNRLTLAIDSDGDSPVVDLHAKRPTAAWLEAAAALAAMNVADERVQAEPPKLPWDPFKAAEAAKPTQVQRSDTGFVKIDFRPRLQGPFGAAVVVSVLTSLMLIAARLRLRHINGDVGAALLLALPVLVAGYLTRPGEHAFATRLLIGTRFVAFAVGVCSLILACLLGGEFVTGGRHAHVSPAVTVVADVAVGLAAFGTALITLGLLRTVSASVAPRAG